MCLIVMYIFFFFFATFIVLYIFFIHLLLFPSSTVQSFSTLRHRCCITLLILFQLSLLDQYTECSRNQPTCLYSLVSWLSFLFRSVAIFPPFFFFSSNLFSLLFPHFPCLCPISIPIFQCIFFSDTQWTQSSDFHIMFNIWNRWPRPSHCVAGPCSAFFLIILYSSLYNYLYTDEDIIILSLLLFTSLHSENSYIDFMRMNYFSNKHLGQMISGQNISITKTWRSLRFKYYMGI